MAKTFHTVVFQAQEGGGNPCPITLDADGLTEQQMQQMTKDFGEESAFLMRPTRPDCDIKARYFVPLHEMEMCIHATIGAATVLVQQGIFQTSPIRFETFFGPVQVDWMRTEAGIDVGVHQFLPKFMDRNPSAGEVCRVLGIGPEELGNGPVQSAATSRWKLIVPLKNRAVLDGLQPDFPALWDLCDQYGTTGLYPYALERDESGAPVFFARQFPKRAGYNEDPATGVAASALGAYLARHQVLPVAEGWNRYTVMQGFAMGRPSVIYSEIQIEDGSITGTRVRGMARLV